MKNIIYVVIIFVFITNCTLNKATNHHGVYFLEKKQQKIFVNKTNNNDIVEILGPPSNTSNFNEKLLYYIERSSTSSKFTKLGKKNLIANNVLILELIKRGIVKEKILIAIGASLENQQKGNRQFVSLGLGYRTDKIILNTAYLIPISDAAGYFQGSFGAGLQYFL
jgi:outer membrane protein assembly factor BamE (lipoprotein component of BamABCDE complex)